MCVGGVCFQNCSSLVLKCFKVCDFTLDGKKRKREEFICFHGIGGSIFTYFDLVFVEPFSKIICFENFVELRLLLSAFPIFMLINITSLHHHPPKNGRAREVGGEG